MDTNSKQTTIIKHFRDAQEDEESALNGEEMSNVKKFNEFERDGASKRCDVLKKALQWKRRNPVKTVLISATCALFALGITGFAIMHETLGIRIYIFPLE